MLANRRTAVLGAAVAAVLAAAWASRAAGADAAGHPLQQAAQAIKSGDTKAARKLIDQCGEEDKKKVAYFLVNAYYFLACDNAAYCLTASRTASRMDPKLVEPHLMIALAQACSSRGKDAMEAIEQGQKIAPDDHRFDYASGLAHAALAQWDKARLAFQKASAGKGALAEEARKRLADFDKFADGLKAIEKDKNTLAVKLDEIKSKLDKVRAAGKKSEDELRALRHKYNDEREQVQRDYNRHVNSLHKPNNNDQNAANAYNRQVEVARNEYNRRMRTLDDRYRPQVAEAQNEVQRHVKDMTGLQAEQRPLQDQMSRLTARENREQAQLREKLEADVEAAIPLTPQRVGELLK